MTASDIVSKAHENLFAFTSLLYAISLHSILYAPLSCPYATAHSGAFTSLAAAEAPGSPVHSGTLNPEVGCASDESIPV